VAIVQGSRDELCFVEQVAGVDSIAAMTGACYVKYMAAAAERSYCTTYSGRDRGILLQLGQAQVSICARTW
jgi:hypothetical protein